MNKSDYSLVYTYLIKALINEGISFLPIAQQTSNEYSYIEPSIQYSTKEFPLIIYDIETNPEITEEIIQKWINHSSNSTFFYIIISEALKSKADSICVAQNITNSMVIPFRFIKNGNNRNVMMNMPWKK